MQREEGAPFLVPILRVQLIDKLRGQCCQRIQVLVQRMDLGIG